TVGSDAVTALAVDDDGAVYAVGRTGWDHSQAPDRTFLRKYSATGTFLWEKEPTPNDALGEDTWPRGLAIGPTGMIYVVGSVYQDGYVTALDEAGEELWTTLFEEDETTAIAIDVDANG